MAVWRMQVRVVFVEGLVGSKVIAVGLGVTETAGSRWAKVCTGQDSMTAATKKIDQSRPHLSGLEALIVFLRSLRREGTFG